jgi:hypothetical protein
MTRMGNVANTAKIRNAYKILFKNTQGKDQFGHRGVDRKLILICF